MNTVQSIEGFLVKFSLRLVIPLLVTAITVTQVQASPNDSSGTVDRSSKQWKIGVIVALTGPIGEIGTSIGNSIKQGFNESPLKESFELFVEDDAFVPRNTVSAFKKLRSDQKIDALITFGSSTSLAVAPLAESEQIPMVGLGIDMDIVKGRKYVFKAFPSTASLTDLTVQTVKQKGIKTIAIATTMQDAMLELKDKFEASGAAKILVNEEVLPDDNDLRSLATRIKSAKPDAVYILLLGPQVGNLANHLFSLGYRGNFIGGVQVGNFSSIKHALEALEGMWFATTRMDKEGQVFKRFVKQYKDEPIQEGFWGYDAAQMLMAGFVNGDVINFLETLDDFHGALGSLSSNGSHGFRAPLTIASVRSGKFQYP